MLLYYLRDLLEWHSRTSRFTLWAFRSCVKSHRRSWWGTLVGFQLACIRQLEIVAVCKSNQSFRLYNAQWVVGAKAVPLASAGYYY
jgi:hypothetical protein